MTGRGRGKELTRPAWIQNSAQQQPPPSVLRQPYNSAPVDWVQAHAADGRPYWYSLCTGQTTWTDPTNPRAHAASAPTARSSQWKRHQTEDGRTYYYNRATKQTQWNAPSNFIATPPADKPVTAPPKPTSEQGAPLSQPNRPSLPYQPLPSGWAEHRTHDGRVYFYHSETRETRWERPTAPTQSTKPPHDNVPAKRPSTALHAESSASSPHLPPDWAESRTAAGKVYYYNKITRETSWTPPSAQPDLKRPRIAPSVDLRTIVSRVREKKEGTRQKHDLSKGVVRRPRSSEGKPLTDRQAETYFLRRTKTRDSASGDVKSEHLVDKGGNVSPSLRHSDLGETRFQEMLREKGITERTTWLEVMSRCASDHRYLLVEPYGRRKHEWMKFTQKMAKARQRDDVLRRRKVAEAFRQLLNSTFEDEHYSVLSLNRCNPESVRSLEADPRYKAVDGRERPNIIKSFFSARARRGSIEHAKRRKEAFETIRTTLDARLHPSLRPPKEILGSIEPNAGSDPNATPQNKGAEGMALKYPDRQEQDGMTRYFDDHTSTHDLEQFIQNKPQSSILDKNDITGVIKSWKRELHALVRERRAREREAKRAQQREYRASFRNGVESMMLSGRLPINPRWKDVCEIIAKENFAKTEAELDARPVDLFEDGVRLFEERVQSHRDEFKRLLKDGGVDITDETTLDELRKTEGLAEFLKHVESPIASALLLDRQRKENKRKQKERDRALADFHDLIRRSDFSTGTLFETALDSWRELSVYMELQKVVGEDSMRKAYDEFMQWRKDREEKRMKRKFEHTHGISRNETGIPAMEAVKRARVINDDVDHFSQVRQQEEENGWAAAVSAKPVNESDQLEERERRKREILESLSSSRIQALGAKESQST